MDYEVIYINTRGFTRTFPYSIPAPINKKIKGIRYNDIGNTIVVTKSDYLASTKIKINKKSKQINMSVSTSRVLLNFNGTCKEI